MLNFRFEIETNESISHNKLKQYFLEDCEINFNSIEKKKLILIHFPDLLSYQELPVNYFNEVESILCDKNNEILISGEHEEDKWGQWIVEILFRPGVTDNVGKSATEAFGLVNPKYKELGLQAFSGEVYSFFCPQILSIEKVNKWKKKCEELLGNTLLHKIYFYSNKQWAQRARFENVEVPIVHLNQQTEVQKFDLNLSLDQWLELNQKNCWALNKIEIQHILNYFSNKNVQEKRKKVGLTADMTDVEMEVLAQSWSEHCKHKIFAAQIDYQEEIPESVPAHYPRLGNFTVSSLYKTYIKGATAKLVSEGLNWAISVFSDNAGIVRFDSKMDVCLKVETHNSPSALDPYGGSLTGILGVNRDILGVGMGARPVANTDVFCFGPQDFSGELPNGVKHPKRIFEGVHLGIEHGGNKSGIPTVNGSINFHDNYSGKPLVFCGTVGVIPPHLWQKHARAGDKILMCGGRIGKDGIHGATMSSLELSETSPVTAVQIGDPITQKRLLDFTLEARDLNLFSAITDNGAGGLSSSVGEMCTMTGGAELDLSLAPVKYPGLAPFELLVSESQERMTYAVCPEKLEAFLDLAKRRNVEASVLGTFTDSGFFHVKMKDKTVLYLDLEFLHESLPQMKLKSLWTGPKKEKNWWENLKDCNSYKKLSPETNLSLDTILLTLLRRPNICSKEKYVRSFDHEVQAATIVKPFCGKNSRGPSDAAVIWMAPHGGDQNRGLVISHGMNAKISAHDTYSMALYSVDEAVRNAVCVGANPDKMALVDNFCWPDPLDGKNNPDFQYKLGQLVRNCYGLQQICLAYKMPLVSGKDSMKNDFIGSVSSGESVKISVSPTLLVTAIADMENISCALDMSFKNAHDLIFLLGAKIDTNLVGSEFQESFPQDDHFKKNHYLCDFDLEKQKKIYQKIFQAASLQIIESAHDVSEGGLLVTVAESVMASGGLGANLNVPSSFDIKTFLFNEAPGQIVVSVNPNNVATFRKILGPENILDLGVVTTEKALKLNNHFSLENSELELAWRHLC